MERPTKAGSFSAFLEARQKRERSQQAAALSATRLLGILSGETNHELRVSDLWGKSGMDEAVFPEALRSLETAGLIALTGPTFAQIARLTPKGEEIAAI